jgi:MFS family permease
VSISALVRGDRDFRRLWTGDALSQVGSQVGNLAVPLTAAVSLRATAWQMALLTTVQNTAFLLIGLPAGVWCDRMRRRPILIAGDLGRAAVLGTIPLAWALGSLTMAHLFAVAALAGVLGVFFDVSYQSYLPVLIGREHLVEGNAALEANRTVAYTVGPAVGGYLVQGVGGPVALLLDAVSFAWSGAWIGAIRSREPAPARHGQRHLIREVREGLGFVFGHPVLRAIALYGSTCVFFGAAQRAVLLLFLLHSVHLSPGTIGVLFTCAGVGSIGGALGAARLARRFGQARAVVLATLIDCGSSLLIPLAARGAGLGFYIAGAAATSFAVSVFNIIQVSFRQTLCPDALLGRMNATMRFVLWGSAPLGALLGGALGTDVGLRPTMWITAIGQVLPFAWIAASPLTRGTALSAAAAARTP